MTALTIPNHFIGCDVGKASIVVFDSRDARTVTIANRPDALAAFAATLGDTCLAVCEATGGYEDKLLQALLVAGCPAHRADARKVKAFIRSFGILGKTDAIDAKALAHYAQERHAKLPRWQAPDPSREELQALVLTRRDLVAQRLAFDNRREAPGTGAALPYLEATVAFFVKQIETIDAHIERLIKAHGPLRKAETILRSIEGVGAKTAAALLALLPELGTFDRRQITALAGLAPHPNQSGGKDAARRTKGGRPEIKRVLFMAAMSAAKHNPVLAPVYKRLLAQR